ncbi:hypothetical protein KP509_28G003700 [Ceratopteris richardii]|nr:hypothetical protein KP509_28G003700 [Ceratopteris richardii]
MMGVSNTRATFLGRFWGKFPSRPGSSDGDAAALVPTERPLYNPLKGQSGFYLDGTEYVAFSKSVKDGSIFVYLAGLTCLLNATISYAADQNAELQQQPQAKSNVNTAKWRIFTDKARDLCNQGSFDDAERYFYKALEAAKLGFGEEDPHVATCYNNLGELFRMKKEYDKAEPLYLEAVKRLRESSGMEDGSVGFALHNLGGFYLLQRKIEQARSCYEEALKIKGRALGLDHPEYANTMFHLGEVLRMQGEVQDSLALIRDSIRIVEQVGLGNTKAAIKRMTRFSELLMLAGELVEAETVQRKILQVLDFSKDFSFHYRVAALQNLSNIVQKQGKSDESIALLEQSIRILQENKAENDIQMAGALSKLAAAWFHRGKDAVSKKDSVHALMGYEKADDLLCKAVNIAEVHLSELKAKKTSFESKSKQTNSVQGGSSSIVLFLSHCLSLLGTIRIQKFDLLADGEEKSRSLKDSESVLRYAISLLEELMVLQENRSVSEVWKIYKECSNSLTELSIKLSELQEQQ